MAPLINAILKSDELLTENQRKQEMLQEDTKRQEAANLKLKADNMKREREMKAMAAAHKDSMQKHTEQLRREFSIRAENLERQMENEKKQVRVCLQYILQQEGKGPIGLRQQDDASYIYLQLRHEFHGRASDSNPRDHEFKSLLWFFWLHLLSFITFIWPPRQPACSHACFSGLLMHP